MRYLLIISIFFLVSVTESSASLFGCNSDKISKIDSQDYFFFKYRSNNYNDPELRNKWFYGKRKGGLKQCKDWWARRNHGDNRGEGEYLRSWEQKELITKKEYCQKGHKKGKTKEWFSTGKGPYYICNTKDNSATQMTSSVASTSETATTKLYDDLSINDYFYCMDNNGPFYHKFYPQSESSFQNSKKPALYRAHSDTCYEGDRISLKEFCKFEIAAKLKHCEGFEIQDNLNSSNNVVTDSHFEKYCYEVDKTYPSPIIYRYKKKNLVNASKRCNINDVSGLKEICEDENTRTNMVGFQTYCSLSYQKKHNIEFAETKSNNNNIASTQNNQTTAQTAQVDTSVVQVSESNSLKINDKEYNYCLTFQGDLRRTKKPNFDYNCTFNGNYDGGKPDVVTDINKFCSETPNNKFNKNFKLCEDFRKSDNGVTSESITTQVVQVPESKVDKTAPILDIEDRITVSKRNYSITGKVTDDSEVYIEADGNSIIVFNNVFNIKGSTPIGSTEIEVVAFDQWGNETKKNIIVERVMQVASTDNVLEPLKPENLRTKNNKNRIALIIGIEEYENISDANYAKRDAQLFIDYVQGAFGVPQSNIKYFFNENAQESSKFEIKDWLKKTVREKTEVYVYFSGHGIALDNGQELYLLTNDTRTQYIKETALNRNEIFNDIAQYNPKSVSVFLDTCYSGAGRADGEMLLAMAKGLVVVDEQQQKLPDNFTLFTAASAQESAWSLPEARHGTFSYFLMKGMEGNADLNGDKKLTNGELRDYLLDNVGRYAQQQQTPQMVGDVNKILVTY